jgi:hypothetical protein
MQTAAAGDWVITSARPYRLSQDRRGGRLLLIAEDFCSVPPTRPVDRLPAMFFQQRVARPAEVLYD